MSVVGGCAAVRVHYAADVFPVERKSVFKKQVAQEEIQEFIDSQKISVVKEEERVAAKNEKIKYYIAHRDTWTAEQDCGASNTGATKTSSLFLKKEQQPENFSL